LNIIPHPALLSCYKLARKLPHLSTAVSAKQRESDIKPSENADSVFNLETEEQIKNSFHLFFPYVVKCSMWRRGGQTTNCLTSSSIRWTDSYKGNILVEFKKGEKEIVTLLLKTISFQRMWAYSLPERNDLLLSSLLNG
jgi:hypothetical protein